MTFCLVIVILICIFLVYEPIRYIFNKSICAAQGVSIHNGAFYCFMATVAAILDMGLILYGWIYGRSQWVLQADGTVTVLYNHRVCNIDDAVGLLKLGSREPFLLGDVIFFLTALMLLVGVFIGSRKMAIPHILVKMITVITQVVTLCVYLDPFTSDTLSRTPLENTLISLAMLLLEIRMLLYTLNYYDLDLEDECICCPDLYEDEDGEVNASYVEGDNFIDNQNQVVVRHSVDQTGAVVGYATYDPTVRRQRTIFYEDLDNIPERDTSQVQLSGSGVTGNTRARSISEEAKNISEFTARSQKTARQNSQVGVRSPSVYSATHFTVGSGRRSSPVGLRSGSPSVHSAVQDGSRASSVHSAVHGGSRSPSAHSASHGGSRTLSVHTASQDRSRSPSVYSATHFTVGSGRRSSPVGLRSGSPSVHSAVQDGSRASSVHSAVHGGSRSPSAHSASHGGSRTLSVHTASQDRSRSPSVYSATHFTVGSGRRSSPVGLRSGSPSVHSAVQDGSRASSVHSAVHGGSRSPSAHSASHGGSRTLSVHTASQDRSRSPSVHSAAQGGSRTLSVHTASQDRSRSPSVHSAAQGGSRTLSVHTASQDRSRSPSVHSAAQGGSRTLSVHTASQDRSRSPSVHSAAQGGSRTLSVHTASQDRSRSPSVHSASHDGSRTLSVHTASQERSRSPSVHTANQGRSRSPSVHSASHGGSRSPSSHTADRSRAGRRPSKDSRKSVSVFSANQVAGRSDRLSNQDTISGLSVDDSLKQISKDIKRIERSLSGKSDIGSLSVEKASRSERLSKADGSLRSVNSRRHSTERSHTSGHGHKGSDHHNAERMPRASAIRRPSQDSDTKSKRTGRRLSFEDEVKLSPEDKVSMVFTALPSFEPNNDDDFSKYVPYRSVSQFVEAVAAADVKAEEEPDSSSASYKRIFNEGSPSRASSRGVGDHGGGSRRSMAGSNRGKGRGKLSTIAERSPSNTDNHSSNRSSSSKHSKHSNH